jgi:hypothetical protein
MMSEPIKGGDGGQLREGIVERETIRHIQDQH